MSRRQAREVALQALFQLDLNPAESADQEEMQETLAIDTALGEAEALPAVLLPVRRQPSPQRFLEFFFHLSTASRLRRHGACPQAAHR